MLGRQMFAFKKAHKNNQITGWHINCSILRKSCLRAVTGPAGPNTEGDQGSDLNCLENNNEMVMARNEADRREFSWRTVMYGFCRSRRHATRRDGEVEPVFTDWHHPWLFFLATGIMIMSSMDAFFTLQLLEHGAYEANPIMAAVMGHSTTGFAASKMLLTGFGILALVFLAKAMFFNRVRTGIFLTGFFSIYAVLICYEFVNLVNRL